MSHHKYNCSRKKNRKGCPRNIKGFFFVFPPLSSKAEICLNIHPPYFYSLIRFRIRKKILFQNWCLSNQTHSLVLPAISVNKTKASNLHYYTYNCIKSAKYCHWSTHTRHSKCGSYYIFGEFSPKGKKRSSMFNREMEKGKTGAKNHAKWNIVATS